MNKDNKIWVENLLKNIKRKHTEEERVKQETLQFLLRLSGQYGDKLVREVLELFKTGFKKKR